LEDCNRPNQHLPNKEAKVAKYIGINSSEFINNNPPKLFFTIPGFLKGTVGALISPGGCGKSMLAMQLCLEIAGGETIGIGPTAKGKVAYICGEDPVEVLHNRAYDLTKNLDESKKLEISKNFFFHIPAEKEIPNILDSEWIEETANIANNCELIVIDTLRRFHREEENSSSAMSMVIASMEEISKSSKCSILFLHHTNKISINSGIIESQQSSRGSSVLVDNVRWQGFLSAMNKQEAEIFNIDELDRKKFVRFGVNKINYGEQIHDVWFKRSECGKLLKSDFFISRNASKKEKKHRDQTLF
jgi:regulatory protein RepA